jgi:hypothetical protein
MSRKLMSIRNLVRCTGLAMAIAATASCGDVVRSNDAPVMLKVNSIGGGTAGASFLLSDVILRPFCTPSTTPPSRCPTVTNDQGTASLAVIMKDFSLAPSTNNDVTVTRYRVEFRRADGHNTPGVDVPHPIDGAVTATIPASGTASVAFNLVPHISKEESPLVQLASNGNIIVTIAEVTFFGSDQVGNNVSATGSIRVEFADFGDAP